MPWFDWLLFIFGLGSVGFIVWFCLMKNHQSYSPAVVRDCLIIIILSIVLILLTIFVILAYI